MSNKRSDEEKLLCDPYVALSTVQRYFSLPKLDAEDLFIKVQQMDQENGYYQIYENRIRSNGVFDLMGLDIEVVRSGYRLKNDIKGGPTWDKSK